MAAPSACQFFGNNIDLLKLSDLSGATINMLLTTSAFTPDTTNTGNTVLANVTNELANGNGYTTGGVALSAPTIATFSTTGFKFSTGAASWTASGTGIPARMVCNGPALPEGVVFDGETSCFVYDGQGRAGVTSGVYLSTNARRVQALSCSDEWNRML